MKTVRIVVVDDHPALRLGVRELVGRQSGMEVVGEAGSGREAIEVIRNAQPDVVVLDVSMPGMDGIEVMKQLAANPETRPRVLALTAYNDLAYLRQLLALGVNGYLLKTAAPTALTSAIQLVADGGTYLDRSVAHPVIMGMMDPVEPSEIARGELTVREREVAMALAKGYSNKEIADKLQVSVKTIETHRASAMKKLNVRGRAQLVSYALRQGWLSQAASN